MLSDQMNKTYRRNVRGGLGSVGLAGLMNRSAGLGAAPIQARMNASRASNAASYGGSPMMAGSGFGLQLGRDQGMGQANNPQLAMLGQLLLAQQAQQRGGRA